MFDKCMKEFQDNLRFDLSDLVFHEYKNDMQIKLKNEGFQFETNYSIKDEEFSFNPITKRYEKIESANDYINDLCKEDNIIKLTEAYHMDGTLLDDCIGIWVKKLN